MCGSREKGCLPSHPRRSRATTTTTCRRRRLSSSPTTSVCFAFGECRKLQLRGECQGPRARHHHCPNPSARDDARGVCEWVAGHSGSRKITPVIRVACSMPSCVLYSWFRLITTLVASHDVWKSAMMLIQKPFSDTVLSETGPAFLGGSRKRFPRLEG